MAQSLSQVFVHIIFSTKNREPWLNADVRPSAHAYLSTVCRDLGANCHHVGGTADHSHIAATLPRTLTQSDLVQKLKTSSTHWLKKNHRGFAGFAWQRGFGVFSISRSQLPALVRYIASQEAHHQRRSFQDEFRVILKRYDVVYDEKYVWD